MSKVSTFDKFKNTVAIERIRRVKKLGKKEFIIPNL